MRSLFTRARIALCCLALVLGACNRDGGSADRGRGQGSGNGSDLPAPEASGGSVTGMPDAPGPGQVGAPVDGGTPPDTPIASDGSAGLPPTGDGSTGDGAQAFPGIVEGVPEDMPRPPGEPTAQDAVALVRDYYGAINARQYVHAYSMWSDSGRRSGQSPQQFADGFADTAGVSVQIDTPGRIDAAAGSRYIEVPVSISATGRDGSVHRYVGIYTLRHTAVDGASDRERMWQITSADIRELRQ